MTQTPRDWQKDMERVQQSKHGRTLCNAPVINLAWQDGLPDLWDDVAEYWLQEAKELQQLLGDEQQSHTNTLIREKQLQTLFNDTLGCLVMYNGSDNEHVQRIVQAYRTLYPDTPAPVQEDAK